MEKIFAPAAAGRHYLNPLFWQKHDEPAALKDEIARMKAAGINDFILEARPHPDYLGPGWWSDLDLILAEAERLDMKVWIFDDGAYPSGKANGELARRWPEYTKGYWAENHMDASGPLPHAHFLIDDWLAPGEELVRVVAARRETRGDTLDSDTLTDVTRFCAHGRLYWPVPEGEWRVFVIKTTRNGGEEHTRDYVNPLSRAGVQKYIELVHERHYAHYGPLFGRRIAGFFTDEPRFGNTNGYDCIIGSRPMPLPCDKGLLEALGASPLGDFARRLPLLWYPDRQGVCRDARYVYMDAVSRLFAQNFTGQLGGWCRAHGVELIGHVVEENGAHARLGYGAGHYFRAMEGLDAAGIDVVDNLLPEQTDGRYTTLFNYYDCDFNHWGLAKMASSAAHADPKKKGRALCEAFGAYGWFEGLKLMKWITDHLAVQGVGVITPHAFSPSPFPDADCPPHFYARGHNPQFPFFKSWADYANRLCDTLSGARHCAPAAVVYHAEAEWGGGPEAAEPFEKAVKALAQAQIDCDVVCIDELCGPGTKAENGCLRVEDETFRALIVPYAENMSGEFAARLRAFAAAGVPVLFTKGLPSHGYFGAPLPLEGMETVSLSRLAARVRALGASDITCREACPDLLYSHYQKDGLDWYLFVNQSTRRAVDTVVTFPDARRAVLYDAYADASFAADQTENRVALRLEAWQSVYVVFGEEERALPSRPREEDYAPLCTLEKGWRISKAAAESYPAFEPTPFSETGDLSRPDALPDFSGTLRYDTSFEADGGELLIRVPEAYETVRIFVNEVCAAACICPPYRAFVPAELVKKGRNALRIEVTNTLVKQEHHNPFDPYFVQEPTGLVSPAEIWKKK